MSDNLNLEEVTTNKELDEAVEGEPVEKVEGDSVYLAKKMEVCCKICHSSLKRHFIMCWVWIGGFFAVMAFLVILIASKKIEGVKVGSLIPTGLFVAGAVFCLFKAVIFFMQNKQFSSEKNRFYKELPEEPTVAIQDFYLIQHYKRCAHYWITFVLIGLSIVMAVYTWIGVGIQAAIEGKDSIEVKLVTKSAYSDVNFNPFTWGKLFQDCAMCTAFGPLFMIPVWLGQYFAGNYFRNRNIEAFEYYYGQDRIIDSLSLKYKMDVVNKKYKFIAFTTVCLIGCVLYIFFKRVICICFDKSFHI